MSNYVKATNFSVKDTLTTGDPAKIIKGTEIDTEFNAIASAVASKADSNNPTLTGTPVAPTAAVGTNSTQLATTAFVHAERTNTATLTNKTLTSPTINGGTVSGITDLAIVDGGTGASTAANARTNLDVPSTSGSGASGTWGISITGNAATATSATSAGNASTVTTVTTNQVTAATAGASALAVGTYAFLRNLASPAKLYGETQSGGNLSVASASGVPYVSGGLVVVVSGTWRCMGRCDAGTVTTGGVPGQCTLWLRIS